MKSTLFENPRDRYWCITLSNDIAETVIGTHYGAVPEDLPGMLAMHESTTVVRG